jgi:hypothetical protein
MSGLELLELLPAGNILADPLDCGRQCGSRSGRRPTAAKVPVSDGRGHLRERRKIR